MGRADRNMLYADGGGIVFKLAEGLAKMTAVHVTAFEATGLTVLENLAETMLPRTLNQSLRKQ